MTQDGSTTLYGDMIGTDAEEIAYWESVQEAFNEMGPVDEDGNFTKVPVMSLEDMLSEAGES